MRKLPLLLLSSLALWGCENKTDQSDKTIVVVTIEPQKWFVDQLASDKISASVMIPPGFGHGTYDPTPKQIRDLENASVYLSLGYLGFEKAWLPKISKNHPELRVVDLSQGILPIESDPHLHDHPNDEAGGNHEGHDHGDEHLHEGTDPHIWMSPKSAAIIARHTANALIAAEPGCKDLVLQRLDSLLSRINIMDSIFDSRLLAMDQKSFLIFHPALTYLARDYGLQQIPMEFEGKEPSASYLKDLVDLARNENIRTVFIQKEYDKENAETLARELNAHVATIDPLSGDWETEMYRILDELTRIR